MISRPIHPFSMQATRWREVLMDSKLEVSTHVRLKSWAHIHYPLQTILGFVIAKKSSTHPLFTPNLSFQLIFCCHKTHICSCRDNYSTQLCLKTQYFIWSNWRYMLNSDSIHLNTYISIYLKGTCTEDVVDSSLVRMNTPLKIGNAQISEFTSIGADNDKSTHLYWRLPVMLYHSVGSSVLASIYFSDLFFAMKSFLYCSQLSYTMWILKLESKSQALVNSALWQLALAFESFFVMKCLQNLQKSVL